MIDLFRLNFYSTKLANLFVRFKTRFSTFWNKTIFKTTSRTTKLTESSPTSSDAGDSWSNLRATGAQSLQTNGTDHLREHNGLVDQNKGYVIGQRSVKHVPIWMLGGGLLLRTRTLKELA